MGKRDSGIGPFLWIFEISKNTYFVEHLWMAAFVSVSIVKQELKFLIGLFALNLPSDEVG